MDKVLRVKCEIPVDYYEEAKRHFNKASMTLDDFTKKITVELEGKLYDVNITFLKNFYSNSLEAIIKVVLDGKVISQKRDIINRHEQLLSVYKLLVDVSEDNKFYVTINLELDRDKDDVFYQGKRNTLFNLTLNDDNYLDALCLNHSLTNKVERMELIYAVLVRKIKTGKYGVRGFKPHLINNLNYMGYDKDYISNINVRSYEAMRNDNEIFDNVLLYLLCNLYGSKVAKLPKDTKYIDNLYDLYFEMLKIEGVIK